MGGYKKRQYALAIGLASLAGFVDSLGFLKLNGLFVSFMSGNSTRMAAGAAGGVHGGLIAAVLIITFVMGVVLGALLGEWATRWRKQAVLGLVTLLLVLASLLVAEGAVVAFPILCMTSAMGAANNVFQRDGKVSIGVTYMTGALVKFGQSLAAAMTGAASFAWLPPLLLWIGLVTGAVAGGLCFPRFGLHALWVASGYSAILLAGSVALGPLPNQT
jgi:uncharacterized membrane protein YoaK (UPF0700 family)